MLRREAQRPEVVRRAGPSQTCGGMTTLATLKAANQNHVTAPTPRYSFETSGHFYLRSDLAALSHRRLVQNLDVPSVIKVVLRLLLLWKSAACSVSPNNPVLQGNCVDKRNACCTKRELKGQPTRPLLVCFWSASGWHRHES